MMRSVDPRRGVEFGPRIREASAAEVAEAVTRARCASRAIARLEAPVLAAGLRSAADELDAERDDLADLADSEVALGVERLRGEIARTTAQLRLFAEVVVRGEHLGAVTSHLDGNAPARRLSKVNVPLGVIAVFAASNFPFAFSVAGGDTASALAAGNAVVVKAHHGHPQTSRRVAEVVSAALSRTGFPADSLQLLQGGDDVGRELVTHPGIAAVGFTGSTAGGRALSDLVSSRDVPIPLYAEQGSVNPVVIAPSAWTADSDGEVGRLAASVLAGHGQFCTKPGLILLPADAVAEFAMLMRDELAGAGDMHLLTPKIHAQFLASIADLDRDADIDLWVGTAAATGLAVPPVLAVADVDTYLAVPRLREEIFGPATVVVGVADVADLVRVLDAMDGNLTATVHGDPDDPWLVSAVESLTDRVGRLVYGGVPTGVAVDRAMHHGGPYPASSSALHTSVGDDAIVRFLRPIAYQDFPDILLPAVLRT